MADLRELIRKDPEHRAAAWAEIAYRNTSRQIFDGQNPPKVERWLPPDLTPPPPLGKGPLED
jgi:hypothetical protein